MAVTGRRRTKRPQPPASTGVRTHDFLGPDRWCLGCSPRTTNHCKTKSFGLRPARPFISEWESAVPSVCKNSTCCMRWAVSYPPRNQYLSKRFLPLFLLGAGLPFCKLPMFFSDWSVGGYWQCAQVVCQGVSFLWTHSCPGASVSNTTALLTH